jgi:hypothetical protein
MSRNRHRGLLAAGLILFVGVTCTDLGPTDPGATGFGRVAFAPSLSAAASEVLPRLVTFGLELDNVRLRLTRPDGELVADTTVALGADDDEIRIDLRVPLKSGEERMEALLELRDGETVLFSGTLSLLVRAGATLERPPELEVDYVGPGASAVSLSINPSAVSILSSDSVDFTATAVDATEQPVPVVAIAWSVKDALRGLVSAAGRFNPLPGRGETYVIARLPTGVKDSAHITILPLPSQVTVVSGAGQQATVGTALPQPIVVEVRASDNLPVPGVSVEFAVASGGGMLSTLTAVTDANGRASTTLTLGTVAGPNTVTVTAASAPVLTVGALGVAGSATRLAMVRQPSAAAVSGVVLQTQPSVRLEDAFGNAVATPDVQVLAAASGITGLTLGGTATATTDAAGVATFSNLMLVGLPGTAALTFTAGNLTSVTSTSIALSAAAPGQILVVSGNEQGALPGGYQLPHPVVVRATDSGGNPRPGAIVTFAIESGTGFLNDGQSTVQQTADANGLASVTWFTNTGQPSLTASADGASAQIRAFVGQRLVVVQQPTLAPESGVAFSQQPVVRFLDNAGNVARIADQTIVSQATITSGQPTGFLTGSTAVTTDANGLATFTTLALHGPTTETVVLRFYHLNDDAENTQVAAALTSEIAVRAGPPWQILPVDPNGRHRVAPGGQTAMTFRVTDFDGFNGVSGVPVSFQPAGSCTPLQTTAISDASGLVRVDVGITAAFTSCTLLATVERDIPLPGGGTFRPMNLQRLFSADAAVPMWVGGAQADAAAWNLSENWWDGRVPTSEPVVFVPGAAVAMPRIDNTATTLQTLVIENFALVDLNSRSLTLTASLIGGGQIANAGTVTLAATRDGIFTGLIFGGTVRVGEPTSQCQPGTIAYTVSLPSLADALEINCGLAVEDGSVLLVNTDLVIASSTGGFVTRGSGGVSVSGNARFNLGTSAIEDGSLTVQGSLLVAPNATLNQSGGIIAVTGDASFNGTSTLTGGVLDLQRNLVHSGNGDNLRLFATHPHRTMLRGTVDPLVITWDAPIGSRLGRVEIFDRSEGGYQFTNSSGALTTIPIHDLLVGDASRLTVPSIFVVNAGGISGLGVNVAASGSLNNLGQILVLSATCTVPSGGLVPRPFTCTSP